MITSSSAPRQTVMARTIHTLTSNGYHVAGSSNGEAEALLKTTDIHTGRPEEVCVVDRSNHYHQELLNGRDLKTLCGLVSPESSPKPLTPAQSERQSVVQQLVMQGVEFRRTTYNHMYSDPTRLPQEYAVPITPALAQTLVEKGEPVHMWVHTPGTRRLDPFNEGNGQFILADPSAQGYRLSDRRPQEGIHTVREFDRVARSVLENPLLTA